MIFDTHAHYDASAFDADRDILLSSLPQQGVDLVVCPGCDLPSSQKCLDIAQKYGYIYAAVGLHPENLAEAATADLDAVKKMAAHPKVVAIGEIGLDYYWLKTPEERANSRDFFDAQLALAEELDLPAIVHDRDAHRDALDIAAAHPNCRGVFHCCALSAQDAAALVDRGWLVSFTGNITFKNARRALEVIAAVPLERMMLETDAPYMAPEPYRGRRCDSTLIPYTAAKIAEIKGISTEEVLETTKNTGKAFFKLT